MKNRKKLINVFNKISFLIDKLVSLISHISVFLFALMNGILLLQIGIRYIAGFSIGWTAELSRMLLISTTFLGSIIVERYHEHMKVPIVIDRLSDNPKRILAMISNTIIIVVMLVFLYSSYLMMMQTRNVSMSSMNFPIAYIYFTLFLCAIFMIIVKILKLIRTSLLLVDEELVKENLTFNKSN